MSCVAFIRDSPSVWKPWALGLAVMIVSCAGEAPGAGGGAVEQAATRVGELVLEIPAVAALLHTASVAPAVGVGGRLPFEVAPILETKGMSEARTGWRVNAPYGAAKLGRFASDPLELQTTGAGPLHVRRASVSDQVGVLASGAVVYQGMRAGVDGLVFATDRGVEDLWVLEGPGNTVEYEVDLPPGWRLHVPPDVDGLVEVRDSSDLSRLRMWARGAWDARGVRHDLQVRVDGRRILVDGPEYADWPVAVDPEWQGAGEMVFPSVQGDIQTLPNGKVLSVSTSGAELYDPVSATFSTTGFPIERRAFFRMDALPSGKVLIIGGLSVEPPPDTGKTLASVEEYDPATGLFRHLSDLPSPVFGAAVALLLSGKVLVAGGRRGGTPVYAEANLLDPTTGQVAPTGSLVEPRDEAAAVPLADGRVLLVGGRGGEAHEYRALASAEVYDPASGTFSSTGFMGIPRGSVTAHLLPSGRVFVSGEGSADVYDPISGVFSPAADLPEPDHGGLALPSGDLLLLGEPGTAWVFDPTGEQSPRATRLPIPSVPTSLLLLPTGKVLAVGGATEDALPAPNAQIFNPDTPRTTECGVPFLPRAGHLAILAGSEVLVGGGVLAKALDLYSADSVYELFEPTSLTFKDVGRAREVDAFAVGASVGDNAIVVASQAALTLEGNPRRIRRIGTSLHSHSFGRAVSLDSGGVLFVGSSTEPHVEEFDPSTLAFLPRGELSTIRTLFTATRVMGGRVLAAGGLISTSLLSDETQTYDPTEGSFDAGPRLSQRRAKHAAWALPDGSVLVTGGQSSTEIATRKTERCHPDAVTCSPGPDMTSPRRFHAMTELGDGRVLVTGGTGPSALALDTAEIFDSATDTFTPTGSMHVPRVNHTSTLLPDGTVLILGGYQKIDTDQVLSLAEIYDPASGTFTRLGSDDTVLKGESLTVLPSGDVLLAGGTEGGSTRASQLRRGSLSSVALPPMSAPLTDHTATLLDAAYVLLAGGSPDGEPSDVAVLFDVAGVDFEDAGRMTRPRAGHSATRLSSGKVLVAGGSDDPHAEVWDPAEGFVALEYPMSLARSQHAAVLVGSGFVVIHGGVDPDGNPVREAEIFDPWTGRFEAIGAGGVEGPTMGLATASGNALFVSQEQAAYYFDASRAFRPTAVQYSLPFAAGTLPSGDLVFFTTSGGILYPMAGPSPWGTIEGPWGISSGRAVILPDGTALVRAHREQQAFSHRVRFQPDGVMPPVLHTVPPTASIQTPFSVRGARFKHMSAVGSEALPALAARFPLVAFMPAAGGGPIYATVSNPTDTSLDAILPPTALHGPGWLHVVVDGVWSEGLFTMLLPNDVGHPCVIDPQCSTGYCADGVCCDRRCDGPCEGCLASMQAEQGTDGTCGPVPAGTNPREGCTEQALRLCGQTGVCDGLGVCEVVPRGTNCGDGKVCRGEGDCTATLGLDCGSNLDCAAGQRCGARGRCEETRAVEVSVDPGSCTVGKHQTRGGIVWWIAGFLLARCRRRPIRCGKVDRNAY